MLYLFMGPSCTGKTYIADQIVDQKSIEVVTGKDYQRLAKNENIAWKLFMKQMKEAQESTDKDMIYVLTEIDKLSELETLNQAQKVRFDAEENVIFQRFSQRMGRELPPPLEQMLRRQIDGWRQIDSDLVVHTAEEKNWVDVILKLNEK